MTQLEFFKTFGLALAASLHNEQLAMRLVNRAWFEHKRNTRKGAA